ncbi:hypothetical protein CWE06_04260 [Aliidiomarina haloalkalitolerans]|uniref:FAD:protein FMN transferase n=2 Tax=Aliidiomarina haloalkalitolerans TaxID=859059 RepID=A0A432VZG1_9GAMM|nr:hypothetical protein CWE06_04260 [Aliidiomarina haloalkalitolerans]
MNKMKFVNWYQKKWLALLGLAFFVSCTDSSMTERAVTGKLDGVEYQVSWRATKHNLNEYQMDTRITAIISHIVTQFSVDNMDSEVSRLNRWPVNESFVLTRELEELFQHGLVAHEISDGRVQVFSPEADDLNRLFALDNHVVVKHDEEFEVNLSALLDGYIADRISELFRLLQVTDYQIEVNGATRLRVSGRQQQRHQFPVEVNDQAVLVSMPYNQDKAFGLASYAQTPDNSTQVVLIFHETASVAHAVSTTLVIEEAPEIIKFVEQDAIATLVIFNEKGEEKRYTSGLFRRFLS